MNFYEAMKKRRSRYDITNTSPISQRKIEEILADAITHTPSAFHSQSSRAVLLFGARHQKLWSIVLETLRAIVPANKFASTEAKIASFAAGHGTILYFEDMATVEMMQKKRATLRRKLPHLVAAKCGNAAIRRLDGTLSGGVGGFASTLQPAH